MKKINKSKQTRSNQVKTRKELRKEQRKMKKQRRLYYYTNRTKTDIFVLRPPDQKEPVRFQSETTATSKYLSSNQKKKQLAASTRKFNDIEKEKQKQQLLQEQMQKQRNIQLIESNIKEDRNIKRLEKQLKLNKRKSQSIPKSFISDGLDYLLEMCDAENMKTIVTAPEINNVNAEFDEDFALMTNDELQKSRNDEIYSDSDSEMQSNFSNSYSSVIDNEKFTNTASHDDTSKDSKYESNIRKKKKCTESFINNEDDSLNDNSNAGYVEDDKINSFDKSSTDHNVDDSTWEDIYGRVRGKDGSIICNNDGKYLPPVIRAKMESQFTANEMIAEKLIRLKKQVKGLLNRLTEANMHSISTQIEELYTNNSRNDMNDTITSIMLESLISPVMTNERLLLEHVLLITILHANVGTDVGAHFLHTLVKQFNSFFNSNQEGESKVLVNTVCVISQLYNFKIYHSKLLYHVLSKLSSRFDEKSVECILSILKNVGFSLRKDDPLALKELIIDLQKKAANAPKEAIEDSRIKYMLDILLAIKNNNMSKIPNYDTSYSEHLKKLERNFIRKGNYVTQLNISLDDLLQADERGRWWIVGSAWSGIKEENSNEGKIVKSGSYSQKLLELARKQRMNTDTRRNIFCIIMSSEDYLDAFEKLLHLGLKNQQEREIIHVILHCCLQEKKFNPYYAVLAQKFCECDRKYQMIIKYSVWDKLKALTECSTSQISNLAKLLTHLFLGKGLPISTLKIVQFGELDKISLRFMRQILLGILLCEDTESCTTVFEKVGQSDKLMMFRERLKLFIRHFVLKNLKTDKVAENQKSLLKDRCHIIERMLSVNEKRTKF